jgi:hypothetical protein
MKETLQKEDLEGEVSSIEAAVPSLSLLEQSPTSNGIRQYLNIMVIGNRQRIKSSRTTFRMSARHFPTKF